MIKTQVTSKLLVRTCVNEMQIEDLSFVHASTAYQAISSNRSDYRWCILDVAVDFLLPFSNLMALLTSLDLL
jgi:hypothetical protein